MKAFIVQEVDELTGGIIYADHAVVARRIGAERYADGEFADVQCRRFPQADALQDDLRAQTRALLAAGWYFEDWCGGVHLSADDAPFVDRIGNVWRSPFVWLETRERAARERGARREFELETWSRFWFADAVNVVRSAVGEYIANVYLPYLRYPARYFSKDKRTTIMGVDIAQWNRAYLVNKDDDLP